MLSLTGLLDARDDSASLRAALDEQAAEYEVLDPDETARRFGITVMGDVVLELHGGTVRADRSLAAFRARVPVEEDVRVLELAEDGDGVRLVTTSGPVEARLAVVAAGAWATPLLAGAGIQLETFVTRETVAYFDLPGSESKPSLIDWHAGTGRHAYSLANGEGVLKVGLHHTGTNVEPGGTGEPDARIVEAISEWVGNAVSGGEPRAHERRDLPLHLYRGRPLRDRAPRADRGLLRLLGPRLQVRAGRGSTGRCARLIAGLSF